MVGLAEIPLEKAQILVLGLVLIGTRDNTSLTKKPIDKILPENCTN